MIVLRRNEVQAATAVTPKAGGAQNSPQVEFNATKGAQKETKCVVKETKRA